MSDKIRTSCGIDFGTSNSTCAVSDHTGVHMVPLEGHKVTLPSALFFCDDGTVFFGREAIDAYVEGDSGRLIRGLKSVLGTSLMEEKTIIRNRARSFTEILSIFLKHLKDKAEDYTGHIIEDVVLGRPVHFHDNDPEADQRSQDILLAIAQAVGFKNVEFQYEPIAAAFAHEQTLKKDALSLVVDLGGGTSDFTVIRLAPDKSLTSDRQNDVLSTSGVRIGGTNFDQRLSLAAFMPEMGLGSEYRSALDASKILPVPTSIYSNLSDWPRINAAQSPKAIRETKDVLRYAEEPKKIERLLKLQEGHMGHAFLQTVEKAKIDLTDKPSVHADFSELGLGFSLEVQATEFEDAIHEQIGKIEATIHQALSKANVAPTDIELVILTGGSSELPIINRMVQALLPNAEVSKGDKFGSVGLGLAYNAKRRFNFQ